MRSELQRRFFYHSFPRRGRDHGDTNHKGLAVLTSIAKSGLLLTPERTEWSEFLHNGKRSKPVEVFQKRICFTELAEHELAAHAKMFGPFALEFSIENLRLLGAIPVFYMPPPGGEERALGGIAAALIARLADIQLLLTRLTDLANLSRRTSNKAESLQVTRDGIAAGTTRCTIGAAEDLLAVLSHEIQPPHQLLNAVRALGGFFYPTEDLTYTGELAYYRQREWRIIANMIHRGVEIARDLVDDEKMTACAIDAEFFERRMRFPTGEHRRVDQCKYIGQVDGRSVLDWAHRIIVPDDVVEEASDVVRRSGHGVKVVAASSLAATEVA